MKQNKTDYAAILDAFDPDLGNIRLIGTNKRSETDYTDVFEVELTDDEIITIRKALKLADRLDRGA